MGRCIGRRDITEIVLKTAFNTIKSVSQFYMVKDQSKTRLGQKLNSMDFLDY